MGQNSKIQWCDHSWNPWYGCNKISEGCKYCYMYRDMRRTNLVPHEVVRSKTRFKFPLMFKDPCLIFTCSWSDFFIKEADKWRGEAWKIIKDTPHITYLILTKRIERVAECLPDVYDNVWLGVSCENQKRAQERIPQLLSIPAKLRFLSLEPLIGPIELSDIYSNGQRTDLSGIGWVIIGGESGFETGEHRYRKCELPWITRVVDHCSVMGVPVFVKQLGTYLDNLNAPGIDYKQFPKKSYE